MALLCVGSYFRHLADGDGAGFGLGNLFLIGVFLPAAGTLLQVGAATLVHQRVVEPNLWKRALVAAVLVPGALFFAGYGLWWCYLTWGQPDVPFTRASLINLYYIAVLFLFATSALACLLLMRRRLPYPGWLFGLFAGFGGLIAAATLAGIVGTLRYVNAPQMYAMVGLPALVWAGAHLATAVTIRRQRVM
jgi:hypothetical protein